MVTKVKLTPMTMGSFAPTFQTGYSWIRVAIPATNMAFCKRTAICALLSPDARPISVIGVRLETNMAKMCCSPKGMALATGTRPSSR